MSSNFTSCTEILVWWGPAWEWDVDFWRVSDIHFSCWSPFPVICESSPSVLGVYSTVLTTSSDTVFSYGILLWNNISLEVSEARFGQIHCTHSGCSSVPATGKPIPSVFESWCLGLSTSFAAFITPGNLIWNIFIIEWERDVGRVLHVPSCWSSFLLSEHGGWSTGISTVFDAFWTTGLKTAELIPLAEISFFCLSRWSWYNIQEEMNSRRLPFFWLELFRCSVLPFSEQFIFCSFDVNRRFVNFGILVSHRLTPETTGMLTLSFRVAFPASLTWSSPLGRDVESRRRSGIGSGFTSPISTAGVYCRASAFAQRNICPFEPCKV